MASPASRIAPHVALCSAIALTGGAAGAPDWIHLVPAGEVRTNDGRGPYRIADAAALMAASLAAGNKLVVDENHATDLAAPRGGAAPARGWIVELQNRSDGIWGRVEWTEAGRQKVAGAEYRGVSPVIAHRKDGTIVAILRASLVNQPNFQGLTALHQEESMDFRKMLIETLSLDGEADDAAIMAAIKEKMGAAKTDEVAMNAAVSTALQSALGPIATLVGAAADADAATVLTAVQKFKEGSSNDQAVIALQSELVGMATQLNTLRDERARDKAVAFVDAAIAAQRVGVKPQRDTYITMHMEDATRTEALINAMPSVKNGPSIGVSPGDAKAGVLGDADSAVIALMGIDPEAYKKTLAAQAGIEEAR